ncbi:MAG: hypothetical protein WC670_15110 [Pseudolabrys sp.]|jgi:hypothetical protein
MSRKLLGKRFAAAIGLCLAAIYPALTGPVRAAPDPGCPGFGWAEGLGAYLSPTAAFPTDDTRNVAAPDCIFQQWSWEAFVWATALVEGPSGTMVPRFMTLQTPDQLLTPTQSAVAPRMLRLAARTNAVHGAVAAGEGAGAIVEADGNMLVAPNGYPVYASVHMNGSYFTTASQNMIANGGYSNGDPNRFFDVGAAVFKATWLRLDPGQAPPAGAYVTQAEVPVLKTTVVPGRVTIEPNGSFTIATVALIGLHVVGHTVNHPEFLWGTFEHQLNSPATPDNTFTPSSGVSDPKTYTLYKAGTPYSQVNIAVTPPQLSLDAASQKISPVTNVVLENATGGEANPNGADNIAVVNQQAKGQVATFKPPQSQFATYTLVGTVWMQANTYNLQSNQTNAVGSINLANGTAETFFQVAKNTPVSGIQNCFTCHNPTSYSFQTPPPPQLQNRLIALSHVLSYRTVYEVPNEISGTVSLGARPKAR